MSKSGEIWLSKSIFYIKNHPNLSDFLKLKNSQNSIISFDYSWFSAKNLSNFVFLPWKLHNRHCHDRHIADFFFSFSLYQEGLTQMTKVISIHEVWFTFGPIKSPAIHINCTTVPKRIYNSHYGNGVRNNHNISFFKIAPAFYLKYAIFGSKMSI